MLSVSTRFLRTEAFRLSAIYAGIFTVSMLTLGTVVFILTDRAFREQIAEFSRADVAAIRHGLVYENLEEAIEVVGQVMAAPGESDSFLLQKDGVKLAGNLPAMPPRVGLTSLPSWGGHETLGVGEMIAPGIYVFAGTDLYRTKIVEKDILKTMGWLFAAALIIAVAGGALLSRTFLRRSDAMARACRAIMDGDLNARLPVRGTDDELDRLATTINEMLDRIAALMENLRQVTNDIAHDLRTPVSQLRQRLERARDESREPHEYIAALSTAIGKTDEILNLFAALLRIAQIEGGARRSGFTQFSLVPTLKHVREMFSAVAETTGHRFELVINGDPSIRGDQALVVQMLSNLTENAILHTPPRTNISVHLSSDEGKAIVVVKDDGPGVPAEEHTKLFQRFYRREASRTRPGYGLGLSLVAAIAELHNASITVLDNPAPGLAIQIAFPLAA